MTVQFGMGIRLNLNQYIKAEGAKLTAFLGNAEWRKDASEGGSASQVLRRIKNRYLHHLRELGYLPAKDREIDIRNDQNVLLYFVAFASRHPLGGKLWRQRTQMSGAGR